MDEDDGVMSLGGSHRQLPNPSQQKGNLEPIMVI